MRIDNISGLSNQGPLGEIPQQQKQDLMKEQQEYYAAFCHGGITRQNNT